ncbi:division/cell wall cluster transcriptional repressor MraZ [Kordiimonas sp. SCSIO 12610]|uniref:division/cell wall cluster transcriptional repressor MraZ n=1 Tax=Kordiimonas sp. SCSIO 12610 TaxID=2829597 RepID=UPI00210B0A4F|nr:hypothetical protein [Kordiimonas sp. SCSIO 12610]UTW56402.1 hypothetical protein KFF44_05725 [Kordiimonas sp. SCSIO 12610]
MATFLSTSTNKVDRKGRVSVPASFRNAAATPAFNGIVVRIPLDDKPYIEGEDITYTEAFANDLHDNFDLDDEEQMAMATEYLASAEQLQFDPEGRVTLPAYLREYAGIESHAVFVGLGKTFQIWEPKAFEDHKASQRSLAREAKAKMKSMRRPRGGLKMNAGGNSEGGSDGPPGSGERS